jgi:hypothetical protein
MLGAIKTIGTVLTVASTAQFGKEMYDKYKDKKKKRQVEEVHDFIGRLDLDALQEAIDTNDTDALIDAVEDIMMAAEAVKVKSDLEELKDDAQEVAEKVFTTVSTVAGKVASKVSEKLDEVKNAVDEIEEDEVIEPTYSDFVNGYVALDFEVGKKTYKVTIEDENVSVNPKTQRVTFVSPKNKVVSKVLP